MNPNYLIIFSDSPIPQKFRAFDLEYLSNFAVKVISAKGSQHSHSFDTPIIARYVRIQRTSGRLPITFKSISVIGDPKESNSPIPKKLNWPDILSTGKTATQSSDMSTNQKAAVALDNNNETFSET